ncbi:hypothetical protein JCM3765_004446 [Sporobolomyces pararoseus]
METEASGSTPPSSSEVFTVYARDTPFRLTRSQIETDSPNYFTSAFLSHGFAESTTYEVHTDRNPYLFTLIVEHLSGYTILPLQPSAVPTSMSVETARENLLRDAKYFGLEQLQELLSPQDTLSNLPHAVSSVRGAERIHSLERLTMGGDLMLDTKVYRPFVSAELPLVGETSAIWFDLRDIPMSLEFRPYTDDPMEEVPAPRLELAVTGAIFEKLRKLQASNGSIALSNLSAFRNSDNTVIKIGDDLFKPGRLAHALSEGKYLDSDGVFRNCDWLKTPLDFFEYEEGGMSLDVVAEAVVVSLQASDQNEGNYTEARATLVYAELKTTEEWTKDVLAPAITVRNVLFLNEILK